MPVERVQAGSGYRSPSVLPCFLSLFLFAGLVPDLLRLLVHLLTGELATLLCLALSLADILRKCSLEILCFGSGKENMIGRRFGAFISFQGKIHIILPCGFQKIPDISV